VIPSDFSTRYFKDAQLDELAWNPGFRQHGHTCPVCTDEQGQQTGRFVYEGVEYECPDDEYGHVALRLAKLYWLHNIPLQYQQLVWDEWVPKTGDTKTKEDLDLYVENFRRLSINGVGVTFYSKGLGTGKTWAATATQKRLTKMGIDTWFAPFYEVKSYYEIEDKQERAYKIARIRDCEILLLDEIRRPSSPAMKQFMADALEDLIRPRTNANLPTIITTNMEPDEIEDTYPRVFSLMSAKNMYIELTGTDQRLGAAIQQRNMLSAINGEALPIT
jgi:DNA replication protein DnaC